MRHLKVITPTVLGALACAAVSSAISPATGISVSASDSDVRIAGSAQKDDVEVASAGNAQLRVTSSSGADAVEGCAEVDATSVRCPSRPSIVYTANGGGDKATFEVGAGVHVSALGGEGGSDHFKMARGSRGRAGFTSYRGDDLLIGGSGRLDSLFGGRGDDRLIGRARQDRLVGSQGRDAFIGGGGDDLLDARDGVRDRLVICGQGDDTAVVDPSRVDPKPRGCETVRRR